MTQPPTSSPSIADRAALWAATGLGIGFIPFAPGTWGSLWGLAIAWGLSHLSLWPGVLLACVMVLVGVPVCDRAARVMKLEDPGLVVYDEFAALALVYFAVPFNGLTAVLGFVIFRVFDVWKPWPLRRLEHLPHGWGIMADDLGAAGYTAAILTLIVRFSGLQ